MRLESSLLHINEVRSCKKKTRQTNKCVLSDMNALIKIEMLININLFIRLHSLHFNVRIEERNKKISILFSYLSYFNLAPLFYSLNHNSPFEIGYIVWLVNFNGAIDKFLDDSFGAETSMAGISNFFFPNEHTNSNAIPNETILIMNEMSVSEHSTRER